MMETYDKITTLGQGAGGAVYLVRHKISKKLLALKKIQLDEKRKTRTREAVQREAKILAQLKHPHIVMYHDSFFEEQQDAAFLCIAQDYCDGGTLDERIQAAKFKEEYFAEDKIMQWFIQLVMAVQFIHSKKILHRDLKTQNVFLTKKDVVKLGDFGISRTLEHTVDKAKTCVGTPCYLSPELCQDQPYNNKSDVWALGCLLYELCAFEFAFDAHNLLSLYYKIVKGDNPTLPSRYSEELQELLAVILEKDPEKRPSATTIVTLSYVQHHLGNFIAEKELLQQQLASTAPKPKSSTSPVNGSKVNVISIPSRRKRPMSAHHSKMRSSLPASQMEDPTVRCQSALGIVHHNRELGTGDRSNPPRLPPIVRSHRPLEPSESGDYPDDFDSSDEEMETAPSKQRSNNDQRPSRGHPLIRVMKNENDADTDTDVEVPEECENNSNSDEDIPEELEAEEDGEASTASSATSGRDRRTERREGEGEGEGEYVSDFEEDEEDSDEGLEDILTNARTAANVDVQDYGDDSFEDSGDLSENIGGCRQLLAEECKDVLGDDIFGQIEAKIRENRGKDLDPSLLRIQFESAIGSERMETCYLLSELLAEAENINRQEKGASPVL